jgi:uncharacterized protein (DUF983 family)
MRWVRMLFVHRCPRCRKGRVFSGLVRMNPACPECGLRFEREPGYFLGAMYFSYALAVAAAAPLVVAGLLLDWPIQTIGWASTALLVVLAPWLFRASRIVWLHFDQTFDAR